MRELRQVLDPADTAACAAADRAFARQVFAEAARR
jgi:hypothetical protein